MMTENDMNARIHIRVVEAKVKIADSNGLADPYCKVKLRKEDGKSDELIGCTRTVWANREPIWNEDFYIDVDNAQGIESNSIILECWDKDKVSSDDFLGLYNFQLRFLSLRSDSRKSQAGWNVLVDSLDDNSLMNISNGTIYAVVIVEDLDESKTQLPVLDPEQFRSYQGELFNDAIKRSYIETIGDSWKLLVTTFNMGDAPLNKEALEPWLSAAYMKNKLKQQKPVKGSTAIPEDFDKILNIAKEMSSKIEVKDRKHFFVTHPQCFTGNDAIKWLNTNPDITEYKEIALKLVHYGIIEHIKHQHSQLHKGKKWFKIMDHLNGKYATIINDKKEYYKFNILPEEDDDIEVSVLDTTFAVPTSKQDMAIYYDILRHNLDIKKHSHRFHNYPHSFHGSDVIKCLSDANIIEEVEHGRQIGDQLLRNNLIIQLNGNGTNFMCDETLYQLHEHQNISKQDFQKAKLSRHQMSDAYDMIVIGVQECSLSLNELSEFIINEYVGNSYSMLPTKEFGQIRLIILVKKEHLHHIRNVEVASVPTGVGNILSNKGGLAMMLEIFHSRIGFVVSHFAAHQDMLDRRNKDFYHILDGISLGYKNICMLNQCEHVLWCGDLNYRIDFPKHGMERTPTDEVFDNMSKLIKNKEYDKLLIHDQLRKSQLREKCFAGFSEGWPLKHPPTFKVEPGNKEIIYQRKRSPAYTDRILWFSQSTFKHCLLQTGLTSVEEVDTSDHKPVRSDFLLHLNSLPPAFTDEIGECSITFNEINITNLINYKDVDDNDNDGPQAPKSNASATSHQSSPLIIRSNLFENSLKISQVATHEKEDPTHLVWNDDTMKNIKIRVNRRERLRLSFVIFQIPKAGTGTLVFCHILDSHGTLYEPILNVPFKVELMKGGIPVGMMRGSLDIVWEQGNGVLATKVLEGKEKDLMMETSSNAHEIETSLAQSNNELLIQKHVRQCAGCRQCEECVIS